MAKSARVGEMRTKIHVYRITKGIDRDGFPTEVLADVFGDYVWVRWVNAHGTEVYDNMRLDLKDVATITMRYSSKIDQECRIQHEDDTDRYEIISIDNVDDRRRYMEIKVKRMVVA